MIDYKNLDERWIMERKQKPPNEDIVAVMCEDKIFPQFARFLSGERWYVFGDIHRKVVCWYPLPTMPKRKETK